MKIPSLSVVIATLGGPSLADTIAQMNRGKLVPSEILVCIPDEEADRVASLTFPNVRIINTACRGQVAQRSIGFQQAQYPLVLQLDDDVFLPEETLELLAEALKSLGPHHVVAPVFINAATNHCCHEVLTGFYGWLKSCYYFVFCCAPWGAKRMGHVTKIGLSFGVDSNFCGPRPFETQWLLGGCALCFKEDLIRDNFFPFKGKAYSEDLIHSYLRTKKGLHHWVIPTAQCSIGAPEPAANPLAILSQNNARRYFVKLSGGSLSRLLLYETVQKILHTASTGFKLVRPRSK